MKPHDDPAADAVREAEWRLQERARDLERGAAAQAGDTARVQRYRQVVRALDQPLENALPSHFAHAGSREIEALAARRRRQDQAFVRQLKFGLLLVYLGGLLAAALVFLPAWQPGLRSLLGPERLLNPWLLAVAGCLVLSWLNRGRGPRARR